MSRHTWPGRLLGEGKEDLMIVRCQDRRNREQEPRLQLL